MTIDRTKWTIDQAIKFDKETNDSARVSSAIGYLFFFVPIIMHPESKFARFHANQSLILTFLLTFGVTLLGCIPYIGPILASLLAVYCIIFIVRGIVLSISGKAKQVPFFGKLVIVEYNYVYNLD